MVNPQCQRCRMTFDTRELLQDHSEPQHGDYMQSRTRQEYLKFRQDRGDDLTMAEQILIANFMSVSKLKSFMRAGKAESDLYNVRVGAERYRKRKANCLGCGESLDTKYGKKYHEGCKPSAYKKKDKKSKPNRPNPKVPVKGKRRRRCAGCSTLFFPPTKKQTKCEKCRS